MFSCNRVNKHLHIRVRFAPFVGLVSVMLVTVILSGWGILWLGFQREAFHLRQTLRTEISGALSDGFEDVMMKHTVRTLELSNCRADLQRVQIMNKDLARLNNAKDGRIGGMGGTP
jgi:hypothetical protein